MSEERIAATAPLSRMATILEGIDQQESDSECGWWETSAGAEFGDGRLILCVAVEREMSDEIARLKERNAELEAKVEGLEKALAIIAEWETYSCGSDTLTEHISEMKSEAADALSKAGEDDE